MTGKEKVLLSLLEGKWYTKWELMEMHNMSERDVRRAIQSIKRTHPLISTSKRCGYKIATTEDDVLWALNAIEDNRCKAITILAGLKNLKKFVDEHSDHTVQLTLDF